MSSKIVQEDDYALHMHPESQKPLDDSSWSLKWEGNRIGKWIKDKHSKMTSS